MIKILPATTCIFLSLHALGSNESPWYVDTQLGYYKTRDSSYTNSLYTQEVFAQYTTKNDWGLYGFAYHDQDFSAAYAGIAYSFDKLDLGIGAGPARYDETNWKVVNSWAYYSDDLLTISLYTEYVPEEISNAEWFYKIQIDTSIWKNWYGGVYSERWYGTGPLLGYTFNDHISVQISVPTFEKEDMKYAASFIYIF